MADLRTLVPFFALIALVSSLLPAIFYLQIPEFALLALSLLLWVVVPSVLASLSFGVAARVYDTRLRGTRSTIRDAAVQLRPRAKDLLSAGLLAGMVALFLVVFTAGIGLIFVPLFFGPPILVQVLALESLPLQSAWARSRTLLRGNWGRVLLPLLAVVVMIALLNLAVGSAGGALTAGLNDTAREIIARMLHALLAGLVLPLLAATGFVLYADLATRASADHPSA